MAKKKKKRSLIQKLPSILAKVEAGKSQATIGDMREIIKKVSLVLAQEPKASAALLSNGIRLLSKQPSLARKMKLAMKRA